MTVSSCKLKWAAVATLGLFASACTSDSGGGADAGAGGTAAGGATGDSGTNDGAVGGYPMAGPGCTDGEWTGGDEESELMHPGTACIQCHDERDGPRYSIAGTIFRTIDEADDCDGAGSAEIEITGNDGNVQTLHSNGAGNFSTRRAIVAPYTVVVRYQGRERVMGGPQESGDCNTCHTDTGASNAPGRILLP